MIDKCLKCKKEFENNYWDPHFDRYGLMGTGYTISLYCEKCRKKEEGASDE